MFKISIGLDRSQLQSIFHHCANHEDFRKESYDFGYVHIPFNIHHAFDHLYEKVVNEASTNPLYLQRENDDSKRWLIEYGSPNIAKPLHPGHMRSLIHGSFISRLLPLLLEKCHVESWCYFGDWGKQFAIVLAALEGKGSEHLTLTDILNIYKSMPTHERVHSICEQMEHAPTKKLLTDHEQIRKLSLQHCLQMFDLFSVKFDHIDFESNHFQTDHFRHLQKNTDGSLCIDGVTVLRSNNTSLYISRDINAFIDRKKKFDRLIYVCDSGQRLHFERMLKVLKKMGHAPQNWSVDDIHFGFGKITNFRTRSFHSQLLLADLIDDVSKLTNLPEADARIMAITHLIIHDTLRPRMKSYEFSLDQLNHHRGLAFKVQYCHARLCSLIEKSGITECNTYDLKSEAYLQNEKEKRLVHHLLRFTDVCDQSFDRNFEAYLLTQYMLQLCSHINHSISTQYVHGEIGALKLARYKMYNLSRRVLNECMRLLGIKALRHL